MQLKWKHDEVGYTGTDIRVSEHFGTFRCFKCSLGILRKILWIATKFYFQNHSPAGGAKPTFSGSEFTVLR